MSLGKPFVCPHRTPWEGRLARWFLWYGCFDHVPQSTKRYMLRRMLAEVPLTDADRKRVQYIYKKGQETGKDVDHILGLADGGLHVPCNLQLLTIEEHRLKTFHDTFTRDFLLEDSGQCIMI